MHKPSLIITILITAFPLYLFKGLLQNIPWNNEVLWISNISAYLVIILFTFSGFAVYRTLVPLLDSSHNSARQTQLIEGSISSIEYSSFRVNKKPMFKVNINYSNTDQVFDPIDSRIQSNFISGDRVYLWINPKDPIDAYFDLEKSLEMKKNI